MSVTVAFHPSAKGKADRSFLDRSVNCQRERQHTWRDVASLKPEKRARYDPQSGHDRERSQEGLTQRGVPLDADFPASPLGRQRLGEEPPGSILIQTHPGIPIRVGSGEELPGAPGLGEGPAS